MIHQLGDANWTWGTEACSCHAENYIFLPKIIVHEKFLGEKARYKVFALQRLGLSPKEI